MAESIVFSVVLPGCIQVDTDVASDGNVQNLRNLLQPQIDLPAGANLRLLQGPQVLSDKQPVSALDPAETIFALICQDSSLEQLLLESATYEGYADVLRAAFDAADTPAATTGPMPCILDVLEDMGGKPAEYKGLTMGEGGNLEFSNEDGDLILPSLDLLPFLKAKGVTQANSVTLCVALNSDAYNRGLGVVLNANASLDVTVNEEGLPSYAYNGYGLKKDVRGNAVKFHPGMNQGQIRVEGKGGYGNDDMGFTPAKWSDGKKLHQFEITLNKDGSNTLRVTGTEEGQIYNSKWTHQLFDGRYMPSMYAWLDLGGPPPLHVGAISARVSWADGQVAAGGKGKGGY